jgi:hypothetical protein
VQIAPSMQINAPYREINSPTRRFFLSSKRRRDFRPKVGTHYVGHLFRPEKSSCDTILEAMNWAFRRALLAAAIIVALLPLVELGDQWESYGSDPEFVSLITVAAVSLGLLLFRREIVFALRRLLLPVVSARQCVTFCCSLSQLIQDSPPTIRAPIRI